MRCCSPRWRRVDRRGVLGLRWLNAGRAVYATGSNREAARLAGLDPPLVVFAVFVLTGALTGLAALLNAIRFNQIPINAGLGLELKVIAAVVVGGAAITGGRGTIAARCWASCCSRPSVRR